MAESRLLAVDILAEASIAFGRASAILRSTSTSEVLTPAESSMASVLSSMPFCAASTRPR